MLSNKLFSSEKITLFEKGKIITDDDIVKVLNDFISSLRYTSADLKISLYVRAHIKITL